MTLQGGQTRTIVLDHIASLKCRGTAQSRVGVKQLLGEVLSQALGQGWDWTADVGLPHVRSEERHGARPGLGELVKSKASPSHTAAVGGLGASPPASLFPCSSTLPLQASAQPTAPGLTPQASPAPAPVPHSRLLLPGDFTGPGPGSATTGVHLRPVSTAGAQAAPGAWDPSIQPWPSLEGGQDPACSVTKGHVDLEAELEGIQQQLQDYQTMKQNLS